MTSILFCERRDEHERHVWTEEVPLIPGIPVSQAWQWVNHACPGRTQPLTTQYEVDRHAEKQDRSYADAWRYFETQGYDMSDVLTQY